MINNFIKLHYLYIKNSCLGDLNNYQQDVLNQLKKWIINEKIDKNPRFNDAYLLKFCRARKFEINKVIEMFSNFLNYRKENGIEDILNTFKSEDRKLVLKYYPRSCVGVDKIGRPLLIDRCGIVKFKELIEICTEERLYRAQMFSYE